MPTDWVDVVQMVPAESSPMRRGLKEHGRDALGLAAFDPAESSPMRRGLKGREEGSEDARE